MTNIFLTNSDEEAIVKGHEELYDKANELFKDKARKECHLERFINSHKLSRCARLSLSRKEHVTASSHNPRLDKPQK